MTTEDDFHTALDANPGDWQARLAFADWLQERGDPRADGYRALGVLRLTTYRSDSCMSYGGAHEDYFGFTHVANPAAGGDTQHPYLTAALPEDWYGELRPANALTKWNPIHWVYLTSRREADDAAALAFAKLPAKRRAELLRGSAS